MINKKKLTLEIVKYFKEQIDKGNHKLDPVDTCWAVRQIIDSQPEQNHNFKEAINVMCKRCINYEVCQGTGCEPKNTLLRVLPNDSL